MSITWQQERRYIETEVLPFSYREYRDFLSANPQNTLEGNDLQNDNRSKFLKLSKKESFRNLQHLSGSLSVDMVRNETLLDYIFHGGLPFAVYLDEKQNNQSKVFLQAVLNTIIEKDIFVRFYKVPRYDVKGKNLLRTFDKYYLSDTGFRKVRLAKGKTANMGHLLENAVYLELRRRYNHVFVGKWNDREVDFVVTDHDGYTSYYQVAWTTQQPETLERELASLNAIKDSNPKYLLTTDIDFNPVYNGIQKLNVVDWMLNVNDGVNDTVNQEQHPVKGGQKTNNGGQKKFGVKDGINVGIKDDEFGVNQEKGPKSVEKSVEKIIRILSIQPQITQKELAIQTNLSRRGVEKNISILKKSGKIERIGSDRNGYWKIITENNDEK